jgi:hypothetical protein
MEMHEDQQNQGNGTVKHIPHPDFDSLLELLFPGDEQMGK